MMNIIKSVVFLFSLLFAIFSNACFASNIVNITGIEIINDGTNSHLLLPTLSNIYIHSSDKICPDCKRKHYNNTLVIGNNRCGEHAYRKFKCYIKFTDPNNNLDIVQYEIIPVIPSEEIVNFDIKLMQNAKTTKDGKIIFEDRKYCIYGISIVPKTENNIEKCDPVYFDINVTDDAGHNYNVKVKVLYNIIICQ